MKKDNKYLFLIAGVIIGGIIVFVFSYYLKPQVYPLGLMKGNAPSQNSEVIDAHFIEQMIPHHEDAVTMSELAPVKATRPEVKELATSIISSQTKEIDHMRKWYKNWFGKDVPEDVTVMNRHGMMGGGMHMGIMGGNVDIENLENSEDFDREFVEQMIPHHQMAVMMANMLENSTERPEMKKLAEDIITTQTSEIEMMRNWLTAWE